MEKFDNDRTKDAWSARGRASSDAPQLCGGARARWGALAALGSFGLAGCASKGGTASGGSNGTDAEADDSFDAVIVGTGGAGLSAAIAAYDKGLVNIVLLEKMGVNGGNTNYASSGMNASETIFQAEQGIQDDSSLFAQETLDGGHNTGDPELVRFMCNNSAAAIEWLDGLGIKLDNITMTGGMSVKRCHRPTDGSAVGLTLVPGLLDAVSERGIPIAMNCEAKELVVGRRSRDRREGGGGRRGADAARQGRHLGHRGLGRERAGW